MWALSSLKQNNRSNNLIDSDVLYLVSGILAI